MSETNELRSDRERKLEMLKKAGMNPYPAETKRTNTIAAFLTSFEGFQKENTEVVLDGRVMALREHGALAFADLYDGTDRIQAFCSKENMDEASFELLVSAISAGDFIEVTGTAFVTKRGMNAIAVTSWTVLTKALLSMPTEHFGIKDEDERYRKRYLDILLDTETREMFEKKAAFWKASRRFMEDEGFAEVHTPTLETTTGGAEASPFVTHHNDFDIDVYLRISVGELWQKRLMAAGLPKVFEMGRVYRNEGTSPDHLQEFTNIEFYAAYMNFDEGLDFLERHLKHVLDEAFDGQRVFTIKEFEVDFSKPFERINYVEVIEEKTGVNVVTASYEDLLQKVTELGIAHEGNNRERLTDTLWKYCRKSVAGPVWLTGHPKLVSPLSKESDAKDGTVLRAQLIVAGTEFNNCFAELNDPQEQRERFEAQAELLAQGDDEAMMPDWEFVEMLEHGMPPTFGAATLGERFFAYLVNKPIRETQYFPLMKSKEQSAEIKNKKETKASTMVLCDEGLELWQMLNTTAHLGASLGAREGSSLLKFDAVKTKDGVGLPLNIQHAIMVKKVSSTQALKALLESATEAGLQVTTFTRDMLETTNDNKVKEQTAQKDLAEIDFLGVQIFGPKSEVEELTKDFELLS